METILPARQVSFSLFREGGRKGGKKFQKVCGGRREANDRLSTRHVKNQCSNPLFPARRGGGGKEREEGSLGLEAHDEEEMKEVLINASGRETFQLSKKVGREGKREFQQGL